MKQIASSPSTKKISDLVGMIRRGELVLQPDFQRKLVWSTKHKEAFIDTILNGYPFPEIYIAQSGIDFETLQTQQVVVDGQQRLSAIKAYVDGVLECKAIPLFAELTEAEKKDFVNYDVVVRDLKDAEPGLIKEVFRRINQTQYGLNDIEIDNAVYEGEFISTAKSIIASLGPDEFSIFNSSDLSRMADLDYVLMLMATIEEGGYYAGSKTTRKYIVEYDEAYPNGEAVREKMLQIFARIKEIDLPVDSIWFRKSNFLTLFVELYNVERIPKAICAKLLEFEINILANKGNENNDFGKYYAAMYTGTNSRASRLLRSEMFRKYCLA